MAFYIYVPATLHVMYRRRYLVTAGGTVSVLFAGCLEQSGGSGPADTDDAGGNASGAGDGNETETSTDAAETEPGDEAEEGSATVQTDAADPVEAIEAYVAAATAEQEAAMAEVMHSEAPLNPDNLDDIGFSFEPFDAIDPADVEVTDVREGVPAGEVLDLARSELWFDEGELDDRLGDGTTFVTIETGHDEIDRKADTFVLATENDQWRVFFIGTDEITDPTLEAVREPEVIDEDENVVTEVNWDVEPYVDDFEPDGPLVEVQLTDSPGVEADTIRVETAVNGGNAEVHNDSDGDVEVTWAGVGLAIGFDPEGDQIEVYAVSENGTETLVHREHYQPSGTN